MSDPAVAQAMSRYLEAKDQLHAAMATGEADKIAQLSQKWMTHSRRESDAGD